MPVIKDTICRIGSALGAYPIGQALMRGGPSYIRMINYHTTPAEHADGFDEQLAFLRRSFENCDMARLEETMSGATHPRSIAITFDDGYRTNYDVAAPLLERHGFTGWFFVSPGRIRGAVPGGTTVDGENADDFMSADELRDLVARGHVVGCHTHSHIRLKDGLSPAVLQAEIVQSRYALEDLLGSAVDTFCWVGGEEWSYSAAAHAHVVAAGYRYAFMTNLQRVTRNTHPLYLQRTNIEAHWPLHQVGFYLSGLMDVAYAMKRRRVAAKLRGAPSTKITSMDVSTKELSRP